MKQILFLIHILFLLSFSKEAFAETSLEPMNILIKAGRMGHTRFTEPIRRYRFIVTGNDLNQDHKIDIEEVLKSTYQTKRGMLSWKDKGNIQIHKFDYNITENIINMEFTFKFTYINKYPEGDARNRFSVERFKLTNQQGCDTKQNPQPCIFGKLIEGCIKETHLELLTIKNKNICDDERIMFRRKKPSITLIEN